jgi:hypothetical protein
LISFLNRACSKSPFIDGQQKGIDPQRCLQVYDKNEACPSNITKTKPLLVQRIHELDGQLLDERKKIDGNNTNLLLSMIHNNLPDGVVKNALLDFSPYLSDKVLLAAINEKPSAMSTGTLSEILIANAPLSESVYQAVINRQPALPKGVLKNIEALQQGGTSPMNELISEINYLSSERAYETAHLIQYYLNDTLVNYDTIKIILSSTIDDTKPKNPCEMVSIYEKTEEFDLLEEEYNRIVAEGNVDDYCRMLWVFSRYKKDEKPRRELINKPQDIQEIETISGNEQSRHRFKAQSAEKHILQKQYEERLEIPAQFQSFKKAIDDEKPKTPIKNEALSNIKIYPNPTSGELYIETSLENTKIKITTLTGQVLLQEENSSSTAQFDISRFVSGIYIIEITALDGNSYREKLILSK